jgi:5-methylcytosine-specific restriction enzyme subunit McrC
MIEILPKADKKGAESEETTKTWRNVLLKMLSLSGNIDVESISEASLKKRHNTLLDLYFEKYIKEVKVFYTKA